MAFQAFDWCAPINTNRRAVHLFHFIMTVRTGYLEVRSVQYKTTIIVIEDDGAPGLWSMTGSAIILPIPGIAKLAAVRILFTVACGTLWGCSGKNRNAFSRCAAGLAAVPMTLYAINGMSRIKV